MNLKKKLQKSEKSKVQSKVIETTLAKRLKNKEKKKLNKTLWESTHILDKKDLEGVMSDSEISDDQN